MKKTKLLSAFLCIVMLFSCISLSACDADPDAGKTPNTPPATDDGGNPDQGTTTPPEDEDATVSAEDKLKGKTVIWNGDSICQGATITGTWADRIAAKNDLKAWKNYGVGGGTIVENAPPYQSGKDRYSVCATLEKMHEEYPDADYIIIEGGTNDADLLGRINEGWYPPRFGSFDPDDFSGNYDPETFCGALESIFYRAERLWPGKKICYIVAQKMGTNLTTSNNRYAYFEAAMQICEKWDIPYLNLWDDCELDPTRPDMYDPNKSDEENQKVSMYRDGQHLTNAGYDLTAAIIDEWLKSL